MRRTVLLACAAGAAAMLAAFIAIPRGAAHQPAPIAPAELALIASPADPFATRSEVRVITVDGAAARVMTLGAVAHAAGAVVRGDVLPGARAVVVAADEPRLDATSDWNTALWRVDGAGARVLVRGLYHASRPLASEDGRVYVERGAPGPWPTPEEARQGRLRADALSLDAVDASTGDARTLATWSGYTAHICGEHGAEIFVYLVAFDGAEIVAVDRARGRVRTVASVPPFARDFSMDHARGALVMSNRDERDARLWGIERLDLTTGARERVAEQRDEAPAPFALPSGEIAWSGAAHRGLSLARGAGFEAAGFEAVSAASHDGAWLAVIHAPHAGAPRALTAVHAPTGAIVRLARDGERGEPLGFIGVAGGGAR